MVPFGKAAAKAGGVGLPGIPHLGFKSCKIVVWGLSEFKELGLSGFGSSLLDLGIVTLVFYTSATSLWVGGGVLQRCFLCVL